MNKEDLKLTMACILVLTLSVLYNMIVMPDKVADRAIQKLKREYVPGPYEPGFDPDKVPPGSIKKN